ncbi:hypothetical protein HKBW3S09_01136, partial [Candidatus Hakubella thermalkaliphila]
ITKGILHNYPCFYDYPTNSYPPETSEILKIWDEEELANLGALKGKVTIDFSAFRVKDSDEPSRG